MSQLPVLPQTPRPQLTCLAHTRRMTPAARDHRHTLMPEQLLAHPRRHIQTLYMRETELALLALAPHPQPAVLRNSTSYFSRAGFRSGAFPAQGLAPEQSGRLN